MSSGMVFYWWIHQISCSGSHLTRSLSWEETKTCPQPDINIGSGPLHIQVQRYYLALAKWSLYYYATICLLLIYHGQPYLENFVLTVHNLRHYVASENIILLLLSIKLCFQESMNMLHNSMTLGIIRNTGLMYDIPLGTKSLKCSVNISGPTVHLYYFWDSHALEAFQSTSYYMLRGFHSFCSGHHEPWICIDCHMHISQFSKFSNRSNIHLPYLP